MLPEQELAEALARIDELEAKLERQEKYYLGEREELKALKEAAQAIWRRSEKMSPLDNTWVQNVLAAALGVEV